MDKYIWAECPDECWPEVKSIQANSYNNAFEKVVVLYSNHFNDDKIEDCENIKELQGYLWDFHGIAISNIEIIDEI